MKMGFLLICLFVSSDVAFMSWRYAVCKRAFSWAASSGFSWSCVISVWRSLGLGQALLDGTHIRVGVEGHLKLLCIDLPLLINDKTRKRR